MAAGTRQSNTMTEMLRKMLGQISELKLTDDPDWDFITGLETGIVSKLREPIDQIAQAGLTAVPPGISQSPMGMAGAGGMGGGMAGPPLMPPPTQMGGLQGRPTMPNPDELRRMLNGQING
jgi:hypothetical protein